MQLQKDQKQIEAAGARIVGISYDPVPTLKKFAEKNGIEFALLSDTESKVIEAYKVRNEAAGGPQAGIPHPTTFVVDREQSIKAKLAGSVPRRHSTEALIQAIAP